MPEPDRPPWSYGCTNHGCMFGDPPGQGTNSTCQCNHPRGPGERARLRERVIAAIEAARQEGRREGVLESLGTVIRVQTTEHRSPLAVYHACKLAVAALVNEPPQEVAPDA